MTTVERAARICQRIDKAAANPTAAITELPDLAKELGACVVALAGDVELLQRKLEAVTDAKS